MELLLYQDGDAIDQGTRTELLGDVKGSVRSRLRA